MKQDTLSAVFVHPSSFILHPCEEGGRMLGKLVPCGGGVPVPLAKTTLVVGRNPDCDITVLCKTVSGRHCELQFHEGAWWVRDPGSKNGTTVNGVRCAEQRLA